MRRYAEDYPAYGESPPRRSEPQRQRDAEDAYWCGRRYPCDVCGRTHFEVDLRAGVCRDCAEPKP